MPQRQRSHPAQPESSGLSPAQRAVDQAVLALQAGRLAEAERLAEAVLKSNWGNARAAQVLGQAMLLQGHAEPAIAPLRQAARRTRDPVVETLLSRALADAGRAPNEVLAPLREAITRRPPHPPAFLELGNRLGQAGEFEKAVQVFEAGLAAAPDAVILRIALGYLHLGRNDRLAARRHFAEAYAAAPDRRDTTAGLANLLARDGEHDQAAQLYRQALNARPDDPLIQINLAKCLLELGRRDEGEALLRTAARGGPQLAAMATAALAATPRGRMFLRPSAAAGFLGVAA